MCEFIDAKCIATPPPADFPNKVIFFRFISRLRIILSINKAKLILISSNNANCSFSVLSGNSYIF